MEPSKRKVVERMPILQTTDLKKYYGDEPNITKALDGVSLSVEHGEFVAIVGTSGSGKSTLLNMIGGLDVPTSGKVTVVGETGKHSFTVASGFLDADFQSGTVKSYAQNSLQAGVNPKFCVNSK